ncbi:MAG: hypothetical protein IJV92_07740 [Phascolarctobacterium sp.]|nr:hypothetical protein [Phascolarctobacterium sp.]
MNFIPLFFICLKMYSFMYTQELAYFLYNFEKILKSRRENPGTKQVIYMDKTGLRFIFYLGVDILFLLYCIYLLSDESTWLPGFFLLSISILEAYAVRARVYGTYLIHQAGYAYATLWFRYLMTFLSLYVLLRLFKG